jgi:hypothetical protein
VEHADALGRGTQRGALGLGQRSQRLVELLLADVERRHAGGPARYPIEAVRVLEHRGVAALLHIGEDCRDSGFDRVVGLGLERQQRAQALLEVGRGGIEFADLDCHELSLVVSKTPVRTPRESVAGARA